MGAERILIVGGGVAGLATAWSLAGRGERGVVVVERERGLAEHSSRKSAAILRTAGPDPRIESLARRGASFLRAPPKGFASRPLLEECGLVVAAGAEGSPLEAWERRALDAGDAEVLAPERGTEVAPHLRAEGRRILRFPRDGRIEVEALLSGFERGARQLGVRFELGVPVRAILVRAGTAEGAVLADGREIRAERTVIAAGGWAGALARAAGSRVRLRPTRRHLLVTRADLRVDPRGPIAWVEEDPFYARPEAGGLMLCHCDQTDVDPDALEEDPAERERILAGAARWLPDLFLDAGARPRPARFWAGIRTMTEDGSFVIGADPDVAGLFWAAGLGGHGMLCSPVVGEIASAILAGEPLADPAAAACDPARIGAKP